MRCAQAFSDQLSALAGLKGPRSPQGCPTNPRNSRRFSAVVIQKPVQGFVAFGGPLGHSGEACATWVPNHYWRRPERHAFGSEGGRRKESENPSPRFGRHRTGTRCCSRCYRVRCLRPPLSSCSNGYSQSAGWQPGWQPARRMPSCPRKNQSSVENLRSRAFKPHLAA